MLQQDILLNSTAVLQSVYYGMHKRKKPCTACSFYVCFCYLKKGTTANFLSHLTLAVVDFFCVHAVVAGQRSTLSPSCTVYVSFPPFDRETQSSSPCRRRVQRLCQS